MRLVNNKVQLAKAEQWAQYCEKEREDKTVKPVLVIQVEDGNDKIVSNTEIESYLAMLETQLRRPLGTVCGGTAC